MPASISKTYERWLKVQEKQLLNVALCSMVILRSRRKKQNI